jgi:two-component system, LuxR family, response regulator FixJ
VTQSSELESPFDVCVVDDDASVRVSITRLLSERGHRVETFDSAAAFLARSADAGSCRLLLDVSMPGIDGIELARRLKWGGRREPVVFMSARDDDALRAAIAAVGPFELIRKPFAVEVLIAALNRAQPLTRR